MSESVDISPSMNKGEALRLCEKTTDIDVIIALTKHNDPYVRKMALREICPCRVKDDVEDFWKRVVEMVDDPDPIVRQQVRNHISVLITFSFNCHVKKAKFILSVPCMTMSSLMAKLYATFILSQNKNKKLSEALMYVLRCNT